MQLCDYIKQIRLRHGLTQKEFAKKLNVTPMHISIIEAPFEKSGRLPSEDLLRRIAKVFSSTEEERKKIEEILLIERAKLVAAPEVRKYIGLNERKFSTPQKESMPPEFLKRLSIDLKKKGESEEFYDKASLDKETLHSVLSGESLLSRRQVIALAVALEQPVDEYLVLSNYMPQYVQEMVNNKAFMSIFRTIKEMTPDDMELVLQSITNILTLYRGQRKRKNENCVTD